MFAGQATHPLPLSPHDYGQRAGEIGLIEVLFPLPRYTQGDVQLLADLLANGAYRPVIDRSYPLEQVVEAARYVETQQKIGNVVLSVTSQKSVRSSSS